VVTLLLVAPIMAIVLRNPKAEVFSPPMILWCVVVVGAMMLVTALRARANQVIDNVPGINMDATLRARLVGEAKFVRALLYFNLENLFGNIPLQLTTSTPFWRWVRQPEGEQ